MIDTNYKIEALEFLLDKECLPEKYYPLIELKKELISRSRRMGHRTKNDIAVLPDAALSEFGLQDEKIISLLRRFLKLYDPRPQKFKVIEKLNLDLREELAFRELFYLPGVNQTRAALYYYSGYDRLTSIAAADVKDVLEKTASAIKTYKLSCSVPLPKEVRTHIAVAMAFTAGRKE